MPRVDPNYCSLQFTTVQNSLVCEGEKWGYNDKQPEQRIAMWLCQHASGFVMIDTQPRRTVIGLEHDEDADAFRREFVR